MTNAFNMPPGCSVRDVPGCGREDDRVEAVMDKIEEILKEYTACPEKTIDNLFEVVSAAYNEGYTLAQAEAREAEELKAMEKWRSSND